MTDILPYQLAFHGTLLAFFLYNFLSKKSFLFRNDKNKINIQANESSFIPIKQTDGSAGYDLYSIRSGIIPPNSRTLIDTGIKLEIPNGFYGRIAARSSLALKYGIDVGGGVIDSDYRGKIKVLLFNHSNKIFKFNKYDRIAQIIFTKIGDFDLELNHLNITDRNDGAFGSTNFIANKYNASREETNEEETSKEISEEETNEEETSEEETNEEETSEEETNDKETSEEETNEKETYEEETNEEETSEEETTYEYDEWWKFYKSEKL